MAVGSRHLASAWLLAASLVVAGAAVLTPSGQAADRTAAAPAPVDPNALPRGADPSVAYLVHDTIRDGAMRVPAPSKGSHDALWVVAGGYLVRDGDVGPRHLSRVVHVSPTGRRRVLARAPAPLPVAVSPSGRRVAIQHPSDHGSLVTTLTVRDARSGREVAQRDLRQVNLVAVTGHRVLLGVRARWHRPQTVWWDYRRDRLHRVYHQAAVRADLVHDRVVLDRSSDGEFCNRVAPLSRPARTLWHSCAWYPHQWSPDGSRALSTHTYFDAAGTDRWRVVDGSTGRLQAQVTGRLDWNAVWEDDSHFLTLAQGDAGGAAIIRCDLAGACERASRVWDVPLPPDPSIYYAAPPVELATRQGRGTRQSG